MKTSDAKYPQAGIYCVAARPDGTLPLPPYLDRGCLNVLKLPGISPGQIYVWVAVNDVLELWPQVEWQSKESSLSTESSAMKLSDSL